MTTPPPVRGEESASEAREDSRVVAGVVIIGDEILSAKIVDRNSGTIIAAMAEHGLILGELAMLPDDCDRIAAVVADFAARFDLVVTTGGVGPTHDDCTWRAVAKALNAPVVLRQDLVERMERYNKGPLSAEQRRMAMMPARATLAEEGPAFIGRLDNVWVLPGVPSMVAPAIQWICGRHAGVRPQLATVYLAVEEWRSITAIDAVVAAYPDLTIGSYPEFEAPDHRLRLTFEGPSRLRVQAAVASASDALGCEHLVRVIWRDAGPGDE